MGDYLYRPVSGAIVFWHEAYSLLKAKAALPKIREKWPEVEIERVLLLNTNARRYWRWRSGKWSTRFYDDATPQDLAKWAAPSSDGDPA